jgi:Protein of unknown function (DUF3551)
MSFKQLIAPAIIALSIGGAALICAQPATAQAVSYSWCTEGGEIHCYYSTRQQCEETVDYHGFCIANPDYSAEGNSGQRRTPPQ